MRVFVAYSGGTDSTYTLLKYKQEGHEVTAVHAQFSPCDGTTKQKVETLQLFCEKYGISFIYKDYTKEFLKAVIQPFCEAYQEGNTPNPCAMCNPAMKFGVLRDFAFSQGAEAFATGHYVQRAKIEDDICIKKALDTTKDQSYFLSTVPPAALEGVLFPLGECIKKNIRTHLQEQGIVPPFPSDSQEICFIPNDDYTVFLEAQGVSAKTGEIRMFGTEEVLGYHKGLYYYTEGQRRGIGITWSEPLYVVGKDRENNRLYVAPREKAMIPTCQAKLVQLWRPVEKWDTPLFVKTRYKQTAIPATVTLQQDTIKVVFNQPEEPVAQGQVLAVYNDAGVVLAAGILHV